MHTDINLHENKTTSVNKKLEFRQCTFTHSHLWLI